jgi:hypothetical protein
MRAGIAIALAAMLAICAAGCTALGLSAPPPLAPTSVQKLEYYPYQVKGYQDTYPHRVVMVLLPADGRRFTGIGAEQHDPLGGDPAIGVVLDHHGKVIQRLYTHDLRSIVQQAIGRSAEEAGMTATISPLTRFQPGPKAHGDYVIASNIERCWVVKQHGTGGSDGVIWATQANFVLQVTVYKPPFDVPFWQGSSSSIYDDPPVGSFGLGPEDQEGIYDQPGEDLSVALTRSVAGIFERPDLRSLIIGDRMRPR